MQASEVYRRAMFVSDGSNKKLSQQLHRDKHPHLRAGLEPALWRGTPPQPRLLVGYTGWRKKTSQTLRNYSSAYTLWRKISFFCGCVKQYVQLIICKLQ